MDEICGAPELDALIETIRIGRGDPLAETDRLIAIHPRDARLHFLRGSLLASAARPIEAHAALAQAVSLAPDFALARFQLGFFELTSGEAARARETWRPLAALPADHYLALFVAGLDHLIDDRFEPAIAKLSEGIAANTENPPLNRDMQLLIDRCRGIEPTAEDPREMSATSLLLGQTGSGLLH